MSTETHTEILLFTAHKPLWRSLHRPISFLNNHSQAWFALIYTNQGQNIKLLFNWTNNNILCKLLIIMTYTQFMCPGETKHHFTAIKIMTTQQLENPLICFYGGGHERQSKESIIPNWGFHIVLLWNHSHWDVMAWGDSSNDKILWAGNYNGICSFFVKEKYVLSLYDENV